MERFDSYVIRGGGAVARMRTILYVSGRRRALRIGDGNARAPDPAAECCRSLVSENVGMRLALYVVSRYIEI
jgi:hypothetical protein